MLTMRLARAYDENDDAALAIRRVVTPAAKVLDLQAHAVPHLRGDGGARRLRLHRGKHHAAALSRGAGQFDLGRFRQRHVPRRAARDGADAECGRSFASRTREAKMRGSRPLPSASKSGLPRRDRADESQARALVRDLVLALQAALLVRHAPADGSGCILRIAARRRGGAGLRPVAARHRYARASPNAPSCKLELSEYRQYERDLRHESRPRRRACAEPARPSCRR